MNTLTENEIKQIQILVEEHYNVIIVGPRFYTYTSFESSSTASGVSIEYNSFRGVDVTPFVKLDRIQLGRAAYLNEFRRYMESKVYLNIKINRQMDYTSISL